MEFKLSRLNNTILAFSIICVALSVGVAYYVSHYVMAGELQSRLSNDLLVATTTLHAAELKKHDYAFLEKHVFNLLTEVGRPAGLCYVRVIDPRASIPPYAYDNTVLISARNDQTGLKNYLEAKLDPLPSVVEERRYSLPASKIQLRDILMPLGNGGVLRLGFRADTLFAFDDDLRTYFIIIGLTMMFLTSLGVLVLNNAVNRRIAQISFEQSERTRQQTRADVHAEIKRAQAAEQRKPDDSPLDSDEFFSIIDFAKKATGTMDMEEVLRLAVYSLVRVVGCSEVTIYMADEAGENLVATVGHDSTGFLDIGKISDERIAVGQGEVGSAAEHGSITIIDMPTPGYALVAAIMSRNQVMGVFRCHQKINGKPFGKREKLICRQISEILGHSLYNVIMYINKF